MKKFKRFALCFIIMLVFYSCNIKQELEPIGIIKEVKGFPSVLYHTKAQIITNKRTFIVREFPQLTIGDTLWGIIRNKKVDEIKDDSGKLFEIE